MHLLLEYSFTLLTFSLKYAIILYFDLEQFNILEHTMKQIFRDMRIDFGREMMLCIFLIGFVFILLLTVSVEWMCACYFVDGVIVGCIFPRGHASLRTFLQRIGYRLLSILMHSVLFIAGGSATLLLLKLI